MRARASLFALAMLATAPIRIVTAAERYETIVIAPPSEEAGEAGLPASELRQAPGAQGDAGKALENLPGVARPALGGGELVVWGATAEETRVVVDGMEIPALYHLGGLRSTVHTGFVRSLALVPGGYGADHGRGLGRTRQRGTAPPGRRRGLLPQRLRLAGSPRRPGADQPDGAGAGERG